MPIQGRPYAPQIRQLMDKFGDLPRGSVVTHEQIEEACGEAHKSGRYAGLMSSFRGKMLREKQVALIALNGVGYKFAEGDEQVKYGASGMQQGMRKIRRSLKIADWTPESALSEEMRVSRRRMMDVGASMVRSMDQEAKKMWTELGITRPKIDPALLK